jgi:hypothetical protein
VQPGDSDSTIKQKQEARKRLLDGMAFASGSAYEEFYGFPPDFSASTGKAPGGSTLAELAQQKGFDIAAAKRDGYTDEEISDYLNQ